MNGQIRSKAYSQNHIGPRMPSRVVRRRTRYQGQIHSRVLQGQEHKSVSQCSSPYSAQSKTTSSRPEHPFPERWGIADEAYPALVAQPMVHWLANFCSVGALRDAPTLNDVLRMRPPPGLKYRTLEFFDHVLDEPVFPEWAASGKTSQTRNPASWGQAFSDLAIRAGLANGSTGFHAVRRKILFDVIS